MGDCSKLSGNPGAMAAALRLAEYFRMQEHRPFASSALSSEAAPLEKEGERKEDRGRCTGSYSREEKKRCDWGRETHTVV
jgi:hypothetical protein